MIIKSVILSTLVLNPLVAYNLLPTQQRLAKVKTDINQMSKSYAERAMKGRLAQARLRFADHNYSDVLVLLGPLLESKNPEVLVLAAHCEFELGNYLAAAEYFKTLSDPTSLYRMVQIEDRFNNLAELEKYYRQIQTPPDFVRYIYARQLLLHNQDGKAIEELQKLGASADYKDQATYIKAVAYVRQGQFEKAQELLTSLLTHQNLVLAQLAKLSSARLYYEQDKPEKAIELYETLNTPEELAMTKIRAGDLSHDLKVAQAQYAGAEKLISDKGLMSDVLLRQEKNDEARAFLQANQNEVLLIQKKINDNDPAMLQEPWISKQPEILKLAELGQKISKLESLLNETELAYEVFEIDLIDRFGADNSAIVRLARELAAIREQLVQFSRAELGFSFQNNTSSAYLLKSTDYELDGQLLSVLTPQELSVGMHTLKVTVTYQSILNYKLVSSYSFEVARGEVLKMLLVFNENPNTKKPQLSLTKSITGTDLTLLDRLNAQDSAMSMELRRLQSEEPQRMHAELLEAKADLSALRVELASLEESYVATQKQVIQEAKPVWLTRLDERIHEGDQAGVQIGLTERLRLQKRIAQLEQVKAAELKQTEEASKP